MDSKDVLFQILESAIDSVRPAALFPNLLKKTTLPDLSEWLQADERFLLCVGKASVSSAESILDTCPVSDYFVLAPEGVSSTTLDRDRTRFGTHPIPTQKSVHAAEGLLGWLRSLKSGSKLMVVLSGGSSALLALPAENISLDSKMKVNQLLLKSGATIQEMNTVRKHLSKVKGGQLGQVIENLRAFALVISDVIGDDLATIGSGPFFPDPSTFSDAESVLKKYELWEEVPMEVRKRITDGMRGLIQETPKTDLRIPHHVIASNRLACLKAAETAKRYAYEPRVVLNVSGLVENVRDQILLAMDQAVPRTALIFGGEATVRVTGAGTGGRNQHLALLMSEKIRNRNVTFAAIGTDGIDGNSPAAGAWVDGRSDEEATNLGWNVHETVQNFDSFPFFQALAHSILIGPTGTNVMDLYVGLID